MKAVIQRVSSSSVRIEGETVGSIGRGYMILLGVMEGDTQEDIDKLVRKILKLRLFPDACGRFDKNIVDIDGEVLVVSQFTLAAKIKKGNRPDFTAAMRPSEAKKLYEAFVARLREFLPVQTGVFGAMMDVEIHNDGPVTILADSALL